MLKNLKSQFGMSIGRLLSAPAPAAIGVAPAPAISPSRGAGERAGPDHRQERLLQRLMRRDLFRLLEQHPDSRRLMRHLGLVERTLRKHGLAAVERLPRAVLAQALVQLELLVRNWSSDGLADMRSRMAMMLRDRPTADDTLGHDDADSDDADARAALERGLVVTADLADVSQSDQAAFEEMERSWAGRMPVAPVGRTPQGDG